MSAPEQNPATADGARVRFGPCATAIVELAARRGRSAAVEAVAARRGLPLPAYGRATFGGGQLAISVRPERWLLLSPPATPGLAGDTWQEACAGNAAVIDLSSGLAVIYLAGADSAEVLIRGCRLDLHPTKFPAGHAAATVIAQVAVTIVQLPAARLLLTPATTARHFAAWLAATGAPFGISQTGAVPFTAISGESFS
ncbi:MAG TPA: sarcosine oxidase subunit gamma family protein [Steroidobacteraceae bacterium]